MGRHGHLGRRPARRQAAHGGQPPAVRRPANPLRDRPALPYRRQRRGLLTLHTPTGRTRRRYTPPRQQYCRLLPDICAFCQGCGRDYNFHPRVLEVDHIRPRSDGGSDTYDNLTLLCPPCNRAKLDRMTLTGLQQQNRRDGYLLSENERNLQIGRATRRGRRRIVKGAAITCQWGVVLLLRDSVRTNC